MLQGRKRRGQHTKVTAALVLTMVALTGCGSTKKRQSTFDVHGKIARDDKNIFMAFLMVATVIGVLVVGGTLFAAIKFRARPGNENPKQIEGNTKLEMTWTVVPALILAIMGVFTVSMIWDQAAKPKNALEITVTGKQWWWQYQYTLVDGETKQVVTANELHIPAGVPIWLTLRSDNVNHSFSIPALMGTKDTINGHNNTLQLIADKDAAGKVFDGQCRQYCGLSHADMRAQAFVDSPENFKIWYKKQLNHWTDAEFAKFATWNKIYTCSGCHYIQGLKEDNGNLSYSAAADDSVANGKTPIPVAVGPNLTHLNQRSTFASGKYELTRDNLANWIWEAQTHSTAKGDVLNPPMDEFGKPMECEDPSNPKIPCVGMPSFKYFKAHPMKKEEAYEIADFLLGIPKN